MRFILSALILLFAVSTAQAKDIHIAMLIKGLSNPYWKAMQEGAQEAAEANHVTLDLQGVQTDQEAEQQLNLCQTILLKKPEALIFAGVNQTNLLPCLKQAQKQNVALIDVDGSYTAEQGKQFGVDVKFSIASNNIELGKKAAAYLKGTQGKVLVLEGLAGNSPGILRVKGFTDNLPKELKVVSSQPGDWDRLKAANITADVLTQFPNLKVIFAANDMMALGAAETVQAKKVKGVTVIGIDGVSDAVKAIETGRMSASVAQLPYLMGKESVEKAAASLQDGKAFSYEQYVPVLLLDKAKLTQKTDPLLRYLR